MALVSRDAAALVKDADAATFLMGKAMELIHDSESLERFSTNVAPLSRLDAAGTIIDEVYKLV